MMEYQEIGPLLDILNDPYPVALTTDGVDDAGFTAEVDGIRLGNTFPSDTVANPELMVILKRGGQKADINLLTLLRLARAGAEAYKEHLAYMKAAPEEPRG